MASAALSMGRHPSLCTPPIGGSSLPSASGFCGDCASVIGSSEVSLSIDQRKLRLASVRALRRFHQSPLIFSKPVSRVSSNNNSGTVRDLRFRALSGENQAIEGEEEKKEPANTTEKLTSSGTSNPSPFAAGKISSKIASQKFQQAENGKSSVSPATKEVVAASKITATDSSKSTPKPVSPATPSVFVKAPASKPAFTVKPKPPLDDGSESSFPTGKVSPFAADRLKSQMASPPSQYNRTSSGRTMINSGKQVLDAFKQGEKDGKTTKFGQPIVPKNIFVDVRQTQEEKDADKFSFNLRPGDIFLIFSFLLIIGLMLGTAFLVWKVGGIHYNE